MSESPEQIINRLQEQLKDQLKFQNMIENQLAKEVACVSMLTADNRAMRSAGLALAEAGLRVCREYDGTHRLMLAVAEWSKAVAGEGGRAARAATEAARPPGWAEATPAPAAADEAEKQRNKLENC